MGRILRFTKGAKDWQHLLARPEKHWKTGYSACTLAHCWEVAEGFSPEIARAFSQSSDPLLANLTPVLAIPEFKVPLPGGAAASQNDVCVLAHSSAGPVCVTVEGKVNEPFGETVEKWNMDASPGKKQRLEFLLQVLGLNAVPADRIRYQLLHRAASAVITGEQYRAAATVLLIHSFSQKHVGFKDYRSFARMFGVDAQVGSMQRLSNSGTPLFGAWVEGDRSFLECEA
jgi:hypothetical protein